MDFEERLGKIFSHGYVCDHCLGRQFAKLLSGFSNDERGIALRRYFAMRIDSGAPHGNPDMDNFSSFIFRNIRQPESGKSGKRCIVCMGFFDDIEKWVSLCLKASHGKEFGSFSVGTSLSDSLLGAEESLWEESGMEYCEPVKAEINREVGKRLEKRLGVKADLQNPQSTFLISLQEKKVIFSMNPLFIYGEYQKLCRGVPQTRWPSGKYKTSVEQIIAKPVMRQSGGAEHKLHGLGREDIDARCLGWRPFVLEITSPVRRTIDMKKAALDVGKSGKVSVRSLRYSSMAEVREIKESRARKKYQVVVICDRDIKKSELSALKRLKGEINQRTPKRVEHRRADKVRSRKVISISASHLAGNKFLLTVEGDAGLYVKELVSGDKGRTNPSVSGLLGCGCVPKDLDVIAVRKEKKPFKI